MTALRVSGAKLVITDKIRSGKFERRLYQDGHLEDVILVNPEFNDIEKLVVIYHELGHAFTTSSQFSRLKAEILV
jgi:Zn-dependent peptidase ImmA (M78 family)